MEIAKVKKSGRAILLKVKAELKNKENTIGDEGVLGI